MKRMVVLGLGVVLLALAGCAGSKEAKKNEAGATAQSEQTREGTIDEVRQNWIAVRDAANPEAPAVRFERTAETDLIRNDQPVSWPELSEGMPVRVSFDREAGAEEARRIEILTGSEADEVRRKAAGSSGWSRPEGISRPPGEGGPPPADMPVPPQGDRAQPYEGMEPTDSMDGGSGR